MARAIERAWDSCIDDGRGADYQQVRVVLEEDGDVLQSLTPGADLVGRELDRVMDTFSPLITRLVLAERADDLIMFHACALADPLSGRVAVLYGPSGMGKTTVARTLGIGLTYLSDETSAVAPDLRIVPYPKPLSILPEGGGGTKAQVSPSELGLGAVGSGSYRLHALVQLRRVEEHEGEGVLEPLVTVEALPELVAQTSFTRQMTRPLHRLAGLAAQVGGIHRATYAEAHQLEPLVRSLLQDAQ